MLGGSVAANAMHYLFNLVMGRIMAPEQYGEVVLIITFITLIGTPFAAVRLALATRAAELSAQNLPGRIARIRHLALRFQWHAGLAVSLLYLMSLPLLARYFRMDMGTLASLTPLLFLTAANASVSGMLQGLQDFVTLSAAQIITAVIKFLGGLALVMAGFAVYGVIGALVLGTIISYAYSSRRLARALSGAAPDTTEISVLAALRQLPPFFVPLLGITILMALFTGLDVMLAKHYLAPDTAGAYSALSVLGRIILYGATAIVTVLLPHAAAERARSGSETAALRLALGLVGAVSAALAILFSAVPGFIVALLYGSHYLHIAGLLPLFSVAMLMSALSIVFIHFFIAGRESRIIIPLSAAIAALCAAIIARHEAPIDLVRAQIIANAVLLCGLLALYPLYKRRAQAIR